mmetsp:Transcript_12818/g.30363  ORF Transcript_12818/g.30363 Transcript_12818/m.30363 type:complete len:160 (+) Transcript_12818:79-558(+)
MAVVSLVARLAERGAPRPPACDDPGRECGPLPPAELSATEGSQRLNGQLRAFVATVIRARTVPELREECRLCSLPSAGQKEELVDRLAGAIGAFSTGNPVDACASPPKRRRLSIKSSETLQPKAQEEQHLLSVRKVTGFKRKRSRDDLCASSLRTVCVC